MDTGLTLHDVDGHSVELKGDGRGRCYQQYDESDLSNFEKIEFSELSSGDFVIYERKRPSNTLYIDQVETLDVLFEGSNSDVPIVYFENWDHRILASNIESLWLVPERSITE